MNLLLMINYKISMYHLLSTSLFWTTKSEHCSKRIWEREEVANVLRFSTVDFLMMVGWWKTYWDKVLDSWGHRVTVVTGCCSDRVRWSGADTLGCACSSSGSWGDRWWRHTWTWHGSLPVSCMRLLWYCRAERMVRTQPTYVLRL